MKKICLIILLIIFFVPKAYGYVNNNTSYSVNYEESSVLESNLYNDYSFYEMLEYFSHYESSYYNIVSMFSYNSSWNSSDINLYIYPKSYENLKLSFYGLKNRNSLYYHVVYPSTVTYYQITLVPDNSDFLDSQAYSKIKNCLDNNLCWNSYDSVGSVNFFTFTKAGNSFDNIAFVTSTDIPSSISNNSSYVVSNQSFYQYIYNSQIPLTVDYDSYYDYSDHYYKKLVINDSLLDDESNFITYKEVYFPDSGDTSDFYDTSLGNIYVGSIPKNNLSNFQATFTYGFNDENYVNSINYKYLFFGRVDNGTYYSYENIDCSSSVLSSTAIDTTNRIATTTFFPYGITCTSSLSNYDNIYIRIYNTYDINTDSTIRNFNGTISSGYYKRLSDIRATTNASYIYEHFDDLDSSFSFMLSTSQAINWAYYETNNKYVASLQVNRQNSSLSSLISNPISYGTNSNTNAIIYNMGNYYSDNTSLDLFINYNSILSFNSSDDSINGTYTYYDSNNTIHTGSVTNNHLLVYDDSYDISYYFSQVNGFIDSLIVDIQSFSTVTQTFYDSAPQFLKLFILSVFILLCLYFLYLLIRK